MGFFELRQFIDRLKRSGNQVQQSVVDLYLKLSFPFANFIILLFGLPLLSNSRKGSTASGFAISLLTCFVFWGLLQTGRALGHSATLSPILADLAAQHHIRGHRSLPALPGSQIKRPIRPSNNHRPRTDIALGVQTDEASGGYC